ncbi:MAG: prolyl aminopeptidase [Hyphomicrobiaceae bacterium]
MSAREQFGLYAPIEPYRTGRLPVGDGHEVYFEECGNRDGKPVLLVHGGPGGGSNPTMRRYHDPAHYRIILFDQRGCGRSTPHASLDENTTPHLLDDMERLRRHLEIERWQLMGGSWGATLAIAYAERYPERVRELVLRGIFLLREAEIHWFYEDGCSWLFPEAYETFLSVLPEDERHDPLPAYHRRLTHPDPRIQIEAARAWCIWEASTMALRPDPMRLRAFSSDSYALAFARIECHYFMNRGFLEADGQLLRDAHRLAGIPGAIIQGRYDVVTPARSAVELYRAWPGSSLHIVPDAGHAMTEPGIIHELVAATRAFSRRD